MRIKVSLRVIAAAVVAFVTVLSVQPASAGALGSQAASMPAGSWAELTSMGGWDSGGILVPTEFGCNSNDYITQYAEKAAWDPVNERVLFVGQAHGSCYGGQFVIFTESTNSWAKGPWPSGVCQSGTASSPCFSHAYDHNTVDPATGDMYFRQAFTMKFFRFRNGSWASISAPPAQSSQCCGALEHFPDLGRLVFVDGDWGVWAYNPASNSWSQIANTNAANAGAGLPNLPMSSLNNFALYNPVQKVLLFGGGRSVYKLSASGAITTMKSSPVSLGATNSVLSVDPVSGKYIVLSGSSMYQYDVATDTWSQVSTTIPSTLQALDGVGDGLVQAPITKYGVIMYVKYNFGNSKVYLYKHSTTAAAVLPKPPAALRAN